MVLSLWGVSLVLALFQLTAIEDWLEDKLPEATQSRIEPWMHALKAAGILRPVTLASEQLAALREVVNAPVTVLQAPDRVASTSGAGAGAANSSPSKTPSKAQMGPPRPKAQATRVVRAPAKRRVLVVGASSIQFSIGVNFERLLKRYEGVSVRRFGKLATGLSRPDFLNWPKTLSDLVTRFQPDLVIANFGGNDAQGITLEDGRKIHYGKPGWDDAYKARIVEMIDIVKRGGADWVMLGMPIMRSKKFSAKMAHLNILQKEATEAEGQLFLSTWEMSSTASGEYKSSLDWQGKKALMRTSDGVHYTNHGGDFVVQSLLGQIERWVELRRSAPESGYVQPRALQSAGSKRYGYLLYTPKRPPKGPAVMFFGPSTWDGADFRKDPHEALLALAEAQQRVIWRPEALQSVSDTVWFLTQGAKAGLSKAPWLKHGLWLMGEGDGLLLALRLARDPALPMQGLALGPGALSPEMKHLLGELPSKLRIVVVTPKDGDTREIQAWLQAAGRPFESILVSDSPQLEPFGLQRLLEATALPPS